MSQTSAVQFPWTRLHENIILAWRLFKEQLSSFNCKKTVVSSHLIDQRLEQSVGSLSAQETLCVVQEDLMETVEDVLKQQTGLLHSTITVKQRLVWGEETLNNMKRGEKKQGGK